MLSADTRTNGLALFAILILRPLVASTTGHAPLMTLFVRDRQHLHLEELRVRLAPEHCFRGSLVEVTSLAVSLSLPVRCSLDYPVYYESVADVFCFQFPGVGILLLAFPFRSQHHQCALLLVAVRVS